MKKKPQNQSISQQVYDHSVSSQAQTSAHATEVTGGACWLISVWNTMCSLLLTAFLWAGLGSNLSHAVTTTKVIDLGAFEGAGTAFRAGIGARAQHVVQYSLPTGSILRSISFNYQLRAGNPYLGDLAVLFADSSGGNGRLLVVGDPNDGGYAPRQQSVTWASGDIYDVGTIATGTIDDSALPDIDLNNFAVFLYTGWAGTWAGTVTIEYEESTTPPLVTEFFPADGTILNPSGDLQLTFDRNIMASAGDIMIKNLANAADTRTISITDATQITITGRVLTINPSDDLLLGNNYAVQIASGAIVDAGNLAYLGISDDTTWNIMSAALTATSTSVIASISSSVYGDNVSFTATVLPIPSGGSIRFYNDTESISSAIPVNPVTGEASISTSLLNTGNQIITAEYSGNSQFAESVSPDVSQTVSKAPTAIKADSKYRLINTENSVLTWNVVGLKNNQNLGNSGITGAPLLSTAAVLASPVGDYPISCAAGDLASDNYEFALFEPGTLTVADPADTFSINFYAYPGFFTENQRSNLLIPTGLPAGKDGWVTDGWVNREVPWGGGLQPTQAITSNKGSTANFIFQDCRNGWASWGEPRSTNFDIGNYNMMAAGVNGTLQVDSPAQPGDNNFKMQLTDIPFATYDIIVYFRSNEGQYGNGTGFIKINGGIDREYRVSSGAFDGTFTEMVDANTPGNYVVITGLTNSTFSMESWGTGDNGFNHNGPAGLQIKKSTVVSIGYSNWIATPSFNVPVESQGFPVDADQDSVPNGVEAWFGTNPGSSSAGITPIGKTDTVFSFTHPVATPALSNVNGGYEWSVNLVDWYAPGTQAGVTVTINTIPDSPSVGNISVQANTTGSAVTPVKLFLRGVATQN